MCANTREQAKLLYDDIKRIIENSPELKDKFIIQRNLIKCKINQNEVKTLSSDYNTTDGLRVSAAVIDEVVAAKDSGLIDSKCNFTGKYVPGRYTVKAESILFKDEYKKDLEKFIKKLKKNSEER